MFKKALLLTLLVCTGQAINASVIRLGNTTNKPVNVLINFTNCGPYMVHLKEGEEVSLRTKCRSKEVRVACPDSKEYFVAQFKRRRGFGWFDCLACCPSRRRAANWNLIIESGSRPGYLKARFVDSLTYNAEVKEQ